MFEFEIWQLNVLKSHRSRDWVVGLLDSRGYQSMIISVTQKLSDTEVQNILILKKSRILYPKFNIKSK